MVPTPTCGGFDQTWPRWVRAVHPHTRSLHHPPVASLRLCSSCPGNKHELRLGAHTDLASNLASATEATCQRGNRGQAMSLSFLGDEIKTIISSLK